ncbi:MAG: aminotransferase class I/II-fold pyridoxal phosphate-dependent enzyme [Albidovulum sp.]|nr:aminotransferase class I/II-fold pyridoxal phosphate-dependent enzyme [Albidovulum sp.]
MEFPQRFSPLPAYAFARLRRLLHGRKPGRTPIDLSIGEPKHGFPEWAGAAIHSHSEEFGRYPSKKGDEDLLNAISEWYQARYGVYLDPRTEVIVLNGSREGLFNSCLALTPEDKLGKRPRVIIPNPFYQVYAAAAYASGAEPIYADAIEENGFLPNFDALGEDALSSATAAYLCSPSNPEGAVASKEYLAALIRLAEKFDFCVFSDECYSEIYRDSPPPSALAVAREIGADPERVLAFNSLSKRSNSPGLRSGFVAGGPICIGRILQLREYGGAPIPSPLQKASALLWRDEEHVEESRNLYLEKYKLADEILSGVNGFRSPEAGLFLWLKFKDGELAASDLWASYGLKVVPGEYFGRETERPNPGSGRVRVAMVAQSGQMRTGLERIREYCTIGRM